MEKSFFLQWYKGRIDRMNYALGLLIVMLCFFLPLFIIVDLSSPIFGGIFTLCYIVLLVLVAILFIGLSVRRLHDIGWNGWLWLIIFFAPAGIVLLFILLLRNGEEKENKYGSLTYSRRPIDSIFNRSNNAKI